MRFILPSYNPMHSWAHRIPVEAKVVYLVVVLILCWAGVYELPILVGYACLASVVSLSFGLLAVGTNVKSAGRLLLLPGIIAIVWTVLYVGVTAYHGWRDVAGATDHAIGPAGLGIHLLMNLAADMRRVMALFAGAATVCFVIATVSVGDLQRVPFVSRAAVIRIELFMSMFARTESRVRRLKQATQLTGAAPSWRSFFRLGKHNAIGGLWKVFVVFIVTVAADVPAIFNFRSIKEELLRKEDDDVDGDADHSRDRIRCSRDRRDLVLQDPSAGNRWLSQCG